MYHDEPLKSLQVELLLESSAREASHKRVLVLRTYSKLAVNITSFFIVCTSIIMLVFASSLTPLGITVLGCATIFATIYSMIVDNIENSKNYSEKCFRMERSSVAMKKLYDCLRQYEKGDTKIPFKQLQEEKSEIIEIYGAIYSITDHNYAKWLHREFLGEMGITLSGLENAEKKYLASRYEVFLVYMIFPATLLIGSFVYVMTSSLTVIVKEQT